KDKNIDVIVADHRMPRMTGVEVLSKVRAMSPRTVRILLTGYADLDAVEGSINESEVFRFLTKPCAPKQLRETIELAAKMAREAPVPEPHPELSPNDTLEIIMEADTVREVGSSSATPDAPRTSRTDVMEKPKFAAPQPAPSPAKVADTGSRPKVATGLGIVVFSS